VCASFALERALVDPAARADRERLARVAGASQADADALHAVPTAAPGVEEIGRRFVARLTALGLSPTEIARRVGQTGRASAPSANPDDLLGDPALSIVDAVARVRELIVPREPDAMLFQRAAAARAAKLAPVEALRLLWGFYPAPAYGRMTDAADWAKLAPAGRGAYAQAVAKALEAAGRKQEARAWGEHARKAPP
jgi:hypothetical protein